MDRFEQLEQYVNDAQQVDLSDKGAFSRILGDGLGLTGMSLRDAATLFKTAPGTISRWENGHCAPPVIAREAVVRYFVTRIKRMLSNSAVTA